MFLIFRYKSSLIYNSINEVDRFYTLLLKLYFENI